MSETIAPLRIALENARKAYYQGNHSATRYWAQIAANIDPNIEEPWLWLAAVSSPRASVAYLEKALSINPQSKRARQGMHWAANRLRIEPAAIPAKVTAAAVQVAKPNRPASLAARPAVRKSISHPWWIVTVLLFALISMALVSPALGFYLQSTFFTSDPLIAQHAGVVKASFTPTASSTPSLTPTLTPSPTPTNTATPLPTATATPAPTDTPEPLPTDTEVPTEEPGGDEPPQPGDGVRWIDVDLTNQMTYAYEGNQIVNSFLVSTGTWEHPTVTGQYYIYVKYLYADMAGPGYYLPDVPYVMYFYDGYGLHGTYWHHNFGTPMSHGCVNLSIPDAGWLFNWADVGTLVNIHY